MPSNASRAEAAIGRMPVGIWIDVKTISRDARLSIYIMANFLMQARKKGIVEKKTIQNGAWRMHLWRCIA